jgi:hypothetical protein
MPQEENKKKKNGYANGKRGEQKIAEEETSRSCSWKRHS